MEDFAAVISENERDRVLSELSTLGMTLASNYLDGQQISFSISRSGEGKLYLRPATPVPVVRADDELELLFTLKDGRYLLKTRAEHVVPNEVTVSIGEGLFRLQRRKNFRAFIPFPSERVQLHQLAHKTVIVPRMVLQVIDLSVGGSRFVWNPQLPTPSIGDMVKIMVAIKGVHNIEIAAQIRNIGTEGSTRTVGVEFQNLSIKEEQTLMLLCMQLQRDSRTIMDK